MPMTITKALEILADLAHPSGFTLSADLADAVELGIEALKRVLSERTAGDFSNRSELPGETED